MIINIASLSPQSNTNLDSELNTTTALISITEKIRSALDSGKVTCGIFIDLQKAFDTVNHEILLKKLDHYGFRGRIYDWFRSYLCERNQKVTINGYVSDNRVIYHGVPQGSVLVPILFLLYINDLHTCIKHSSTLHFADDTNLLNVSSNYKTLTKEINKPEITVNRKLHFLKFHFQAFLNFCYRICYVTVQ